MFYEKLNALCKSRGLTVTSLLKELNISTSKGTAWKNGSIPKGDILSKLADYFNVSTDYLLGNTDTPRSSNSDIDSQTLEFMRMFERLPSNKRELALKVMKVFLDDE